MIGQIIKILSDTHYVKLDDHIYPCKCRGKFRQEHITPFVGDYVSFDKEQGIIEEILPRSNFFVRPPVSNIDQAFLITSLKDPLFSTNLLDKLIVIMESHGVRPIICLTKKDLLSKEEWKKLRPIVAYYKKIGYSVVFNHKISKIKKMLRGKMTVFTGQTGAGKSTLLNRLNPLLSLETGEISKALGRGKHTTRHVEIFSIASSKVLDTPGFSALDFRDIEKREIRDSFIEFSKFPCPFKDCFHLGEAECEVKKALREGKILESRYQTYQSIMKEK